MSTIEELLADSNPVNKLPTPDPSLTIDHYGQLKEMGLDYGWGPTAFFEWLIEHVHLMTGYGWGGSIIISTVVIRACLFWFQAQGSDNLGKLAAMKPVLESYQKKTEEAIQSGNTEQERLYKMKQQQIGQEIGVKLGKGFMGPIAIGVFGYGAFRCLRGMSTLPVPGMSEAGFLWFTDLTVGDPYYALPALTGALMWVVMKVRLYLSSQRLILTIQLDRR
jgi:YidC/Oxa1 family membrane protein insertase